MFKALQFFCLFLFCAGAVQAQQTAAGVLLGAENSSMNWRPLAGFTLEHRKTKHSGFEAGIQYRSAQTRFNIVAIIGADVYNYVTTINEHHLTLPFLYKYHSRIANFAVGPSFDFYLGYNAKASDPRVITNSYSGSPTFGIGALLKLSKTINLTDQIFLEPELRINPVFNSGNTYAGFAVGAKYRLKAR